MNHRLYISLIALLVVLTTSAQNADDVLKSIYHNNLTLRSIREGVKADRLDNLTGLNLKDPEIEFNHKWGSPNEVQDLTELSVSQTFDYATVFGLKRKLAHSRNELLALESQQEELLIMLQAKELLVNLVYANRMHVQMDEQVALCQTLVDKLQKSLEAGETSKLEVNKARLTLAEVQAESNAIEVEHKSLYAMLKAMNGGQAIAFNDTIYPTSLQTSDMTSTNILRSRKSAQQSISQQEIRAAKTNALPELSLGYVAEYTKYEKLRGIGVGLNIPLWSNHNNVRRAKAQRLAQEAAFDDATHQLMAQKEELEIRASSSLETAQTAYRLMAEVADMPLLSKALHAGEISLLDYIMEIQTYYQLKQKAQDAERDYWLAIVRLSGI